MSEAIPLSTRAAAKLYFATGGVALCVTTVCTLFSFAAGLGWLYLLPTFVGTALVLFGMLARAAQSPTMARLSAAGALLCAGRLMAALVQDIQFQQRQPQFAFATVSTLVLLLLLAMHPFFVFAEYRDFQ